MNKLALLPILLAICLSAGFAQNPQPSPAEIIKMSRCVLDENCAAWLSYKKYDSQAVEVVFSRSGKRYTMFVAIKSVPKKVERPEDNNLSGFISFWVRPEGTTSLAALDTFTANLTGIVGLGIDGSKKQERFFDKNNEGIQLRKYWQDRFNSAFRDTLAYIAQHKK